MLTKKEAGDMIEKKSTAIVRFPGLCQLRFSTFWLLYNVWRLSRRTDVLQIFITSSNEDHAGAKKELVWVKNLLARFGVSKSKVITVVKGEVFFECIKEFNYRFLDVIVVEKSARRRMDFREELKKMKEATRYNRQPNSPLLSFV